MVWLYLWTFSSFAFMPDLSYHFGCFDYLAFAILVLDLYSHPHTKRPSSTEVYESP